MAKKDRNVIERLEDIENKIPTKEEPKSFSKTTGLRIEDYIKIANIYLYDEDERAFNKGMRDSSMRTILAAVFVLLFFVFSIVAFAINKEFEWLLIISNGLSLLDLLIRLSVVLNQKRKQPLKSFWSIEKPEFYVTYDKENRFTVHQEKRHSLLYYISLIIKILALAGVGTVICYLVLSLANDDGIHNMTIFCVGLATGFSTYFINLFCLTMSAFTRNRCYLFETDRFCFYLPNYELVEK